MLKHFVIEDITGDLDAAGRMADEVRKGFDGTVTAGYDGLEVLL